MSTTTKIPASSHEFPGVSLLVTSSGASMRVDGDVCGDCFDDEETHVPDCSFIHALAALPPGMDLIGHLIYQDEFWREVLTFRFA